MIRIMSSESLISEITLLIIFLQLNTMTITSVNSIDTIL
jgi:hypothetical protein